MEHLSIPSGASAEPFNHKFEFLGNLLSTFSFIIIRDIPPVAKALELHIRILHVEISLLMRSCILHAGLGVQLMEGILGIAYKPFVSDLTPLITSI